MRTMKRKMEEIKMRRAKSSALTSSSPRKTVTIEALASTDRRKSEIRLRRRNRMNSSEMAHFVPQRMLLLQIMILPKTLLGKAHWVNRLRHFLRRDSICIRETGAD